MHTRSIGLALATVAVLIVSACTSGAATTAPTTAASAAPASEAPASAPASAAATSALKIGVVTDAAGINDKGFNEFSYKGAVAGTADIGATKAAVIVPKDQSEYAKGVADMVGQKFDIIITVGFNLAPATIAAAKANPSITFVGVDQLIGPGKDYCVDETGALDPKYACKGDAKVLLPKYIQLVFQEDQAGYLAGMVAASASKSGTVGAIGGLTTCGPCVRYLQGYELGALSINPNAQVKTAYVTHSFDPVKSFNDPPGGKAYALNFMANNPGLDVLFQVAGATGNGILDAACAKGIWGIGVDVDQHEAYAADAKCILTSAEKHLQNAVEQVIKALAAGPVNAGPLLFNAANGGVGVSDFHDHASAVPSDLQAKLDAALAAMKAGTLVTCPATGCGVGPK